MIDWAEMARGTLPDGKVWNLWIKEAETQHIRKLVEMVGVHVIESPCANILLHFNLT